MSYTELYCYTCQHWSWDGKGIEGHCSLYSANCANAIFHKHPDPPPRYLRMEEPDEEAQDNQV